MLRIRKNITNEATSLIKDLMSENERLKKKVSSLEERVLSDETEGIKLEIRDKEDSEIKSIKLDNQLLK